MDITRLNMNFLTNTAIIALKNAYDECGDNTVKESIITAFRAIIKLNQYVGKHDGGINTSDCDSDIDPSEYCAAV